MSKDIGNRIREARINKGWTQERLAQEIGATKYTVCKYENETIMPNERTLGKIASALNIELSFLIGGVSKSYTIDFYSDPKDRKNKSRISPVIIPDGSDYFSVIAPQDYPCGIRKNDTLVLRPLKRATSGDLVFVVNHKGEPLIGLLWAQEGALLLFQETSSPPIDISDGERYEIIAKVMYSIKDFGRR